MKFKDGSLQSILTSSLRLFLLGEFFINLSDMYALFLPLFMSELGATIVEIGLVYTLSDIVPIFLNILGGWLSDIFGRLRTITWSNIIRIFSFVVMIIANQWGWMILAFAMIGVSGALGGPSFAAYIADNTEEEHRT
jgi:MFS family permease